MEILSFAVGLLLQWILEVAGAGGAIWGMSEVWKMRGMKTSDGAKTNDDLRIPANIVFALGTIRFLFRYAPDWGIQQALVDPHAWFSDWGASRKATTPDNLAKPFAFEIMFFAVGLFMQFVLEVAGAGGAWWGMSEVWGWRGYGQEPRGMATNDNLRPVSNIVFAIAAVRMAQKYFPDHAANTAMHSPHDYKLVKGSFASFQMECVMFLVGLFMQFVLEVAGAGGAWWGMSEVWGLRGYGKEPRGMETNDNLRPVSNIVFCIAAVRMIEKYLPDNNHHTAMNSPHDWVLAKMNCYAVDDDADTQRQNQTEEVTM